MRYITVWLRSFLLKREEERFLNLADLVHVQTENECRKVKKLISTSSKIKIVVAPNGIKEELFACAYNGIDSDLILYMTHLHGDRQKESEWFIKKVWIVIRQSLPNAKLLVTGTPPKAPLDYIADDMNIIVNGYAENMIALYNSVRLVVVPTFHGTGLINRIQDALTAGVPVVSTPRAISTFTGIKPGEEILAGGNVRSFADQVINLYNQRELRLRIACNGKRYARQCATWKRSAEIVQNEMNNLLK
jgi:glycosyltransferase involved in cell wall biosynthesis